MKIVNLTEKHQNLCRVAKQMYGQHMYNQILSRCADSKMGRWLGGNYSVRDYFFSISQVMYNMGKQGG